MQRVGTVAITAGCCGLVFWEYRGKISLGSRCIVLMIFVVQSNAECQIFSYLPFRLIFRLTGCYRSV